VFKITDERSSKNDTTLFLTGQTLTGGTLGLFTLLQIIDLVYYFLTAAFFATGLIAAPLLGAQFSGTMNLDLFTSERS